MLVLVQDHGGIVCCLVHPTVLVEDVQWSECMQKFYISGTLSFCVQRPVAQSASHQWRQSFGH